MQWHRSLHTHMCAHTITGYINITAIYEIYTFTDEKPSPGRDLFDRQLSWLERILPVSGNTPLRHNIYLKSSSGGRRHNGWQCVLPYALRLTLLLNIIRQANMTYDEEDGAAKPTRKEVFKNPIPIFSHSTKTNFCSSIKLSVVSVAPQTHSRAPKKRRGGGGGGGGGRETVGDGKAGQTVGECVKVKLTVLLLAGNGNMNIFYNKSLIIFTALSN